MAPFKD